MEKRLKSLKSLILHSLMKLNSGILQWLCFKFVRQGYTLIDIQSEDTKYEIMINEEEHGVIKAQDR